MKNKLRKNAEKGFCGILIVAISELMAVYLHDKTGLDKTVLVPAIAGAFFSGINFLKNNFKKGR